MSPGYPLAANTYFKITRVVGPGLPTEYPNPNSLELAPDESVGYEPPDPDAETPGGPAVFATINFALGGVTQGAYRKLFQNDRLELRPCPSSDPQQVILDQCVGFVVSGPNPANLNDFNVTRASATPTGFVELGGVRANHSTIGRAATGQMVLDAIKSIEFDLTYAPVRVQ